MGPMRRGWFQALIDWIAAWYFNFPQEVCSYTVDTVSIPLAQGKEEAIAYLYQPLNVKPLGTLLVRTPYGIGGTTAIRYARIFAAQQYQVLLASCRGTGPSKGNFQPFHEDTADGHATVAWMRQQKWYTGSFATMGLSYFGYTQWAILADQPSDMKTAVIFSGLHDMSKFTWGTGALNSGLIAWSDIVSRMVQGQATSLLWTMVSWRRKLPYLAKAIPLLPAVEAEFGGKLPSWCRDWLTHPNITDSYWKRTQHGNALDHATIPIMLVTGWYDILLDQVMDQYARLSERGQDVSLIIGPWNHTECADKTARESLHWLQEHFTHDSIDRASSKVRLFITGKGEWRDTPAWPPASDNFELHLAPNGMLSKERPSGDTPNSVFKFDPQDPTPTIGSSTWMKLSGMKDEDSALAARSDVLCFTSDALNRDLEVLGKPSVTLYHSTNPRFADILARISEVDAKGQSHNIAETYLRLNPNRGKEPLQLNLADCAHVFRKGMRVRLVITGGSHPHYVRNLGSGEDSVTGSAVRQVWHTIEHDASAISKIILPVCS